MVIANAAYARYYEKNKEKLLGKMKGRYNSEKKHEYYETNKEKIRQQNADRYRDRKATANKAKLEELAKTATGNKLAYIQDLLTTDKYKTANNAVFEFLME